ncbi:hypothetical protein ACFLUU_08900 [Chloroflexota bacterium]
MANPENIYRCILSPGIVEIRSNTKFMLGGYALNFSPEKALQSKPSSKICITSLVSNNIPHRQPYADTHFFWVHGKFGEDVLYYDRTFFRLVNTRLELKGLRHNPTITVNTSYNKFVRIRTNLLFPFGTFVRDVLSTQLLMQDYGAIHGAACGISNEGILIIGLPGIGKSTVLFDVLKQGFQYITEDMMLVDSDGYLHSCPGASSFAYDIRRTEARYQTSKMEFLSNKWKTLLAKTQLSIFLDWPYMDILSFFPQVEPITHVKPRYIFILAKGNRHIGKLSAAEAVRMLIAVNRHTFAYQENDLLFEYSLLNPWLNLSELMQTEERLLGKIVNSSTCFLCTAPEPHDFFTLMQQKF